MNIKTAKQLAEAAKNVALNYKTLYIMGCFGAPMTDKNKKRYTTNHEYNKDPKRTTMINAASSDTFGFDCVGLIKGLLWGWEGSTSKTYGGATYKSNEVPDIGADAMMKRCSDLSEDFSDILVGEAVGTPGHIGIYIGDGLAVEATPSWSNKVQITSVGNIRYKPGYPARYWKNHGKLPYVSYEDPKVHVTYRVYTEGRWLSEVTDYNEENTNGYAGIYGKEISGIQVRVSTGDKVTIRSHVKGSLRKLWLLPVTKWSDKSSGYSGWKGKPTDCIAMKADNLQLKYRVHVLGGEWLPWVTGYDIDDYANGLAGIYGKSIDAVQITVI